MLLTEHGSLLRRRILDGQVVKLVSAILDRLLSGVLDLNDDLVVYSNLCMNIKMG